MFRIDSDFVCMLVLLISTKCENFKLCGPVFQLVNCVIFVFGLLSKKSILNLFSLNGPDAQKICMVALAVPLR